jgi:hypothetical protein
VSHIILLSDNQGFSVAWLKPLDANPTPERAPCSGMRSAKKNRVDQKAREVFATPVDSEFGQVEQALTGSYRPPAPHPTLGAGAAPPSHAQETRSLPRAGIGANS